MVANIVNQDLLLCNIAEPRCWAFKKSFHKYLYSFDREHSFMIVLSLPAIAATSSINAASEL